PRRQPTDSRTWSPRGIRLWICRGGRRLAANPAVAAATGSEVAAWPRPRGSSGGGELVLDPAQGGVRLEQRADGPRVELAAGLPGDLRLGVLPGAGLAIRPVARHRVEGVHDREDACAERDLVAD